MLVFIEVVLNFVGMLWSHSFNGANIWFLAEISTLWISMAISLSWILIWFLIFIHGANLFGFWFVLGPVLEFGACVFVFLFLWLLYLCLLVSICCFYFFEHLILAFETKWDAIVMNFFQNENLVVYNSVAIYENINASIF